MTTRRRVWLYVALFAVAVAVYYPFSPARRQRSNMLRAERHIESLAPRLEADPRFANVRLRPFTAEGGSLGVFGTVASDEDAEALRSLVRASNPPVELAFRVVVPRAATRRSVAQPVE